MKSLLISKTLRPGIAPMVLSMLAFFIALSNPTATSAADDCGFGQSIQYEDSEGKWVYNEEEDNYTLPDGTVVDDVSDLVDNEGSCAPTTWMDNSEDDGFGAQFRLMMWSDEEGQGANSYEALELICYKRTLSVYIWADYPVTRGWSGTGQLKFDSGSTKTVGYKVNNTFDGLYLTSPKTFTKAFLSAKTKATFKINTYDGSLVLAYPKADLGSYVAKFKKLGCPLK